MKILSVILAFYVLVFSIKPCCTDDNCIDNGQSIKTEQTSDNHQHDNDCKDDCSPFFTCGTCVGFTLSTVSFSLTSFTSPLTKLISIYHPSLFSEFHHSIWQPPKIS